MYGRRQDSTQRRKDAKHAKVFLAALAPLRDSLLFLVATTAFAQWTPELSMKVKTVSPAVPSADGRMAAWTETHPVMDGEKSESVTQVFLARADGTNRIQLTRGDKSSNAPSFSPDGAWVFFATDRSGKRNVYRIPVDGGEAEMLTNWTGTLGNYSVSPNGKWIAFAAREADTDDERVKREKRDFRALDENPKNQSLWLVAVEPDISGKRALKKIAAGPYNVGAFDWSPNSQRIAYETRPTPDADDGRKADIYEVAIETGDIRPVAATPATESQPRYSPDGRFLAFVRSNQTAKRIDGNRIVLLALNDSKSRELPPTPDESPALAGWARDSSRLYFSEGRGTRTVLYAMPVDGPPAVVFQAARGSRPCDAGFGRAGRSLPDRSRGVEARARQRRQRRPAQTAARRNTPDPLEGEGR